MAGEGTSQDEWVPATDYSSTKFYFQRDADFLPSRPFFARKKLRFSTTCRYAFVLSLFHRTSRSNPHLQVSPYSTCERVAVYPGASAHAGGHAVPTKFYSRDEVPTSVTHPSFRFCEWRVREGHSLLSGDASVSSTAGRLGSTEADLIKSSTAGGDGDLPATIMYCKFEAERERERDGRGQDRTGWEIRSGRGSEHQSVNRHKGSKRS